MESFKLLMPGVEHRYCVRHMYANFKDSYKGKELKDLMWSAARAYTVQEFERHMDVIKGINADAYTWLMNESPTLWARCTFSCSNKCDMLRNNISESFNHFIKDARDKPIITMMEMIRRQLMSRYEERRKWIAKFPGPLCPQIHTQLEEAKIKAKNYEVTYARGQYFEVSTVHRTHIVDLDRLVCSYRKWDVTSMPCIHAIATIISVIENLKTLCMNIKRYEPSI